MTPQLVTDLDGIKFLTITPRDYGLIKVISSGVIDDIKPYSNDSWSLNCSLVHTHGYKDLRVRRNGAQRALLLGDNGAAANEREQRIAAVLDDDLGSDADGVE